MDRSDKPNPQELGRIFLKVGGYLFFWHRKQKSCFTSCWPLHAETVLFELNSARCPIFCFAACQELPRGSDGSVILGINFALWSWISKSQICPGSWRKDPWRKIRDNLTSSRNPFSSPVTLEFGENDPVGANGWPGPLNHDSLSLGDM